MGCDVIEARVETTVHPAVPPPITTIGNCEATTISPTNQAKKKLQEKLSARHRCNEQASTYYLQHEQSQ
jgi:hypothetical protein